MTTHERRTSARTASGSTWPTLILFSAAIAAACGSTSRGLDPGGGEGAGARDGGDDASVATGSSSGSGGSGGFGQTSSGSGGGAPGPPRSTTCDPSCAAAGGTCSSGVCAITENPAGAPASTQTALKTGGKADASFKWLYPYDRTVFARGLVSPTLQFAGSADTVEVRMTSTALDYTGYFKVTSSAINIALSQKAWQAVTVATLGADTLKVSVSKMAGTAVAGPITESWRVAQGSLRGTVFNDTYASPLAGAVGIMQIEIGATQPTVFKSGCGNVCHSESADGSTMVADTTISTSASYDLRNKGSVIHSQTDDSFAYGGVYPNGSLVMSSTTYLGGLNTSSRLYDVKTGATIAAPGWDGVVTMGGTTQFSPDGKQIAFIHEDKDSGHTLAKMDFDVAHTTFSNLVDLATDPSQYVGWPAFTPDGKQVVYHLGSSQSLQAGFNATADLYTVNIATRAVHRLDALDGYSGTGSGTYLPSSDTNLNAVPSVLPEAVGGYFWVVFTSHRSYGNLLETKASADSLGKLWVAAIDLNPTPGQDPSHPAFYLDGQELMADNLRAFWTLPPCQATGVACESGDQCCTGFCRAASGGKPVCVTPPMGCSNEYEKCTTSSECCGSSDLCIDGRCAQMPPK